MSHFLIGLERRLLEEIGLYDGQCDIFNMEKGEHVTTATGFKVVCVKRIDEEDSEVDVCIDAIHPDGDELSYFGMTICYTNVEGLDEWHITGLI